MGSELGFEYEFLNNSYAAGLAGMTVGSIFFIPSALIFGRKPVYLFAAMTMILVNVGQARFQRKEQYIVLQVLAGLAGSVNDTIIQMTVRSPVSMPNATVAVADIILWCRYRISSSFTSGLR